MYVKDCSLWKGKCGFWLEPQEAGTDAMMEGVRVHCSGL